MKTVLYSSHIDTPLGPMQVISDEHVLFLLEFLDNRKLDYKIKNLIFKTCSIIVPEMTDPIFSITHELQAYFNGSLKEFKTPFRLEGTPFQKKVWQELLNISYGKVRSYRDQAQSMATPRSCRAVGSANGANPLAILIPCHRVICGDGRLGGYSAGIDRKQWLINHEKKYSSSPQLI